VKSAVYKKLKNSNNKIVHWTNKMALQKIYGKQLSELQEEWEKAISEGVTNEDF